MAKEWRTDEIIDSPDWLALPFSDIMQFYSDILGAVGSQEEDRLAQRVLCLNDLYFLLIYGCQQDHFISEYHNNEWLYNRCREVQLDPNGHLDLWAREHFKSSVITFGLTIFDILRDPDVTFGIFSHNKEQASVFVSQIGEHLMANQHLKYLFPEVLWDKPSHSPAWNESEIIVRRLNRQREPTIMACGLLKGMPTGMHFSHRVYDDIVTDDMVGTPGMIKKMTDRVRQSTNLGKVNGVARFIGTRYHLFDTYRTMMDERWATPRIHAATSDGSDDPEKSVFLPVSALMEKRKIQGIYIFGCQQLQNPKSDDLMGFSEDWLQYWEADNLDNMNFMIICDPATASSKIREKDNLKKDYTAIWVIGKGGDDNYYVCDMIRARLNLQSRADAIFTLHRRYRKHGQVRVGYEQIGCNSDIQHFEDRMSRENYRFKIIPLGGIKNKNSRINRLHPLFEEGRIWLPKRCLKKVKEGGQMQTIDMTQVFIQEEYLPYPVLAHDDMLDALSRITDDDMKRLPAPEPRSTGYNAVREIELRMLENEPVV